ncbi:unnamed protein product [Rhizoctonia solani]|uniref:Uncharacterized protein n=1 Tax=Rhizoctonia solani TaxID=456999 RepID=A0A8H3ECF3_9AGAM|nr:unnamed protein product [Rhizoctonia solani]
MRTHEDSAFEDYGYENRSATRRLAKVDSDSELSRNEQNNVLKLLSPFPDEQIQDDPKTAPKGRGKPVIFSGMKSAIGPVWRVIKFALVTYLVLVALPYTIFESFPEVVCKLPVLSEYTPYCAQEHGHSSSEKPIVTPDFVTLVNMQSGLNYVMEDSASGAKVAVDIKDSEMALRDLATLVRYSALSNKDPLESDLKLFVKDAKVASGNLQQFGSRVWGSVDRIVSLNKHMLIQLENTPTGKEDIATYRKDMEAIWRQGLGLLSSTLRKLIHEAQDNVGSLQRLEERLNNIEDMVSAEKHEISRQEQELKQQWVRERLGLNEEKRQSHGASLELLTTIKDDRKRALSHVTGALLQLTKMSNDLDELRDGVVAPVIISGSSNTPVEAHIESIRSGTEQLVNGQLRMRTIEDEYRRQKFSTD